MTQNSRDLRVRRTHKLLREAVVALIEEQRFDSITVEAIAERAMVSRAAFYRHYQDKYDLVAQIFAEAMQTMMRDIDLRFSGADLDHPPEPWVRLFEHFAAYGRLYRALLGAKGSPWFQTNMRMYLAEVIGERTAGLRFAPHQKRMAEQRAFASGFVPTLLAGLLIDAITWWFEQEQPDPPRQIAISCYNLVLSTLKEASRWE
jgi:AcrR family transcriptional regulator